MSSILDYISKITDIVLIAIEIGGEVLPLINKIKEAAAKGPNWTPSLQDWNDLDALEQSLRDKLNAKQEGDA